MTRLFAYGTLKQDGISYHKFLEHNSTREANAVIPGLIMYDDGEYPVVKEGNGNIRAESYLIEESLLPAVDENEDEGKDYTRKEIVSMDGRRGWIYVYNGSAEHLSPIESGTWWNL